MNTCLRPLFVSGAAGCVVALKDLQQYMSACISTPIRIVGGRGVLTVGEKLTDCLTFRQKLYYFRILFFICHQEANQHAVVDMDHSMLILV